MHLNRLRSSWRPSVVFIRSRQAVKQSAMGGMLQEGADQGDGNDIPFPFLFRGQQGGQGFGGRQYRMQPPAFTPHAEASGVRRHHPLGRLYPDQ